MTKDVFENVIQLPQSGYLRQSQLVGDPRHPEKPHLLPFSAATLWRLVRSGEFPAPVKLSERVTAWRVEDVRAWMASRYQQAA
jgi:predicted DNA-binding transcriptional regulator AlpA